MADYRQADIRGALEIRGRTLRAVREFFDGEGYLEVEGKMPSNTSGGLVSKGHPIGATGLGQIHEIVHQLRGSAGRRQVKNPKVGMTHNGGGILGVDAAAMALHILEK